MDTNQLYEFLFSEEETMTHRNKILLMYLHDAVQENRFDDINNFLNDPRFEKLHISLLYSSKIMLDKTHPEIDMHIVIENIERYYHGKR